MVITMEEKDNKEYENHKRVIVYYTDSKLDEDLAVAVRQQIIISSKHLPIISVSKKPLDFGTNICVGEIPQSYLSIYQQLLAGLEAADDDAIIYTCEHDVFYHASHFKFIPPRPDRIYYNLNRYYWTRTKNYFTKSIGKRALSQGVAYKNVYLNHVKEQVSLRSSNESSPCVGPFEHFVSRQPNIDIRHDSNFSDSARFKDDELRYYTIPYWGTPRLLQHEINFHAYCAKDFRIRKHLHDIFNPEDKPNPVEILGFTRSHLIGLFYSLGFKKGAEIGVRLGMYSREICAGIPNVKLLCIDPYHPGPDVGWDEQEDRYRMAKELLAPGDVTMIRKTSLQAAEQDVPKGSLDFVYIDASHKFDDVMQDIIVWADRIRPGGIISGHDYQIEDVRVAVDAYVKMHNYELFITEKSEHYPNSAPSWFFSKGKDYK